MKLTISTRPSPLYQHTCTLIKSRDGPALTPGITGLNSGMLSLAELNILYPTI